MPKQVIDAKEALELIRAGVSDARLMAKYNLSTKGLRSLFTKLVKVGAIEQSELDNRFELLDATMTFFGESAAMDSSTMKNQPGRMSMVTDEFVEDILRGTSDTAMMQKYGLSAVALETIYDKLVSEGILSTSALDEREESEQTVDLLDIIRKLGMDNTHRQSGQDPIPSNCVACGAPQTMELDECPDCGTNIARYKARKEFEERSASWTWKCPACDRPQNEAYEECPICGVIVSKYKKRSS